MQAFLGSAPFARTDTNSGANARHCKGQKQIQKLQYSVKDRLHHPGQQAKAVLIAGVNYHHRKNVLTVVFSVSGRSLQSL